MPKRTLGLRGLAVVILVVITLLAAVHRLGRMDRRFFNDSVAGTRALVHYLIGDYGDAARWYRTDAASWVDPNDRSSATALQAGNLQLTETIARRQLEQEPGAVGALLSLAEVALARGQHAEALAQAGRVLQAQPDDFDALLLTAVAHARRTEWNPAIDALKRALAQDRVGRRYTVFLAALEVTGDLDEIASPPLCLLAHLHRYLRIFDPSQADSAISYARRAIAAADRSDDAWVTIAIVTDQQGKRRKALEAFDRAIALNASNTAALLGAARLRSDRGEIAIEYRLLRAAFEAAPDDPMVVDRLHFMLTRKLGDYRQALAMEQAHVAARPTDARAWWRLGSVQASLADYGAALTSFERATAIGAGMAEAHEGKGWALLELGRREEALAEFQRAIELDPRRPGPFVGVASINQAARRYPQAIAALEQAGKLGGLDGNHVAELCGLYLEAGDLSRASACLSQLLTRDPDNVRGRGLLEHVNKTASRPRA